MARLCLMERHKDFPFPVDYRLNRQFLAVFDTEAVPIGKETSVGTYGPFNFRPAILEFIHEKPVTGDKGSGISCFHVPCDDGRAYIFRCECDHSAVLVNQFHNMFVSLVYQLALPSYAGYQEQHVFFAVETHIAAVPGLQTFHQIFKFVRIHMLYPLAELFLTAKRWLQFQMMMTFKLARHGFSLVKRQPFAL